MARIIEAEERRQRTTLMMIASENHSSGAVEAAVGSKLGSKYSEGYPGRRFYQGQENSDAAERLTVQRAMELFGVPYVNVQPHSGSPANLEAYMAIAQPGATIMGLSLDAGGHLTHGADASATSKIFRSVQYGVDEKGLIDYEGLEQLAEEHRPKIIVAGTTAYARILDWARFAEIADKTGAYLVADVSHVAGLIAGDVYPSPVPYADIVTTTTHKTLRGPRGAMIMVTEKGLKRDPDLGKKVDSSVFPGLQGGPHMNSIAGIGIALREAQSDAFREYARQTIVNARALSTGLEKSGFDIVTGGTDCHLVLVDLRNMGVLGRTAAEGLEAAGIVMNRNAVPHDPNPPFYPSGLRVGTAALTSRGMRAKEMQGVAGLIGAVVEGLSATKDSVFPEGYDEQKAINRKKLIAATACIPQVREVVTRLCVQFPMKDLYTDY